MQWWPRVLATVAAVVVAGLGLAVLAAPARAQPAERILDYTVDVEIEAAGSLLVTEQIAYDFGTQERHGIFREVPVRFRYDDRQDRIYPWRCWESGHRCRPPASTRWRRWTTPCGSASATPTS